MNKLTLNKFLHPLLVGAAIAASAAGAKAQQIDNGGFEAGLAGWAVFGDASLQGSAPEGLSQLWLTTASATEQDDFPLAAGALNRSGVGAIVVGSPGGLETAVGLPLTALDPDLANGIVAFEGSAASRSVSANAGDVLSFSWNFGTSDSFADYAFFVVDGERFTLADTSQALLPTSFLGNSFETGVATYSHVFANAGAHQISFGVVDIGDFGVTSTLAIDNVQISPVPEAPAVLMLFAGLAAAALRRRKA
ncbi:MAG: hypothetical protein Q8R33_05205 [Burkholderiales bacterium]|nr:hypothetical protein [Burkholderiales bacterium]